MYVKTMTNRVSALFVALVMMLSMLAVGASAWAADDGIEVFWNGTSVGKVKYDEMKSAIADTADVTYSTLKEEGGTATTTTGKVYTFDQLLAKVGKTEDWAKAGEDSKVVMTTPGYDKEYPFTKTALTETRNAYNENGSVKGAVPTGFLLTKNKKNVELFQFIYGQTDTKDTNQTQFLKFEGKVCPRSTLRLRPLRLLPMMIPKKTASKSFGTTSLSAPYLTMTWSMASARPPRPTSIPQ